MLTDNGSEFTDRFAVDKKGKPHDKPSGTHPFDLACAARALAHRLTRPFRPQTNGMVERFNRRLGDHLDRMPQNRAAHHRRPSAGADTTPTMTLSPSISPMSVAQTGTPRT